MCFAAKQAFSGAGLAIVCLVISGTAYAHDSPNDVIDALSHRIEAEGATAALLVSRAYEYRAYGDMESAERDLRGAMALNSANGAAYISLGQLYVYQGKGAEALEVVRAGLSTVDDQEYRGGLHALGAEAHVLGKAWTLALDEIGLALEVSSNDLERIQLKSMILGKSGRHEERVLYLREASNGNSSVVLVIELVDGLRDARRYVECLKLIDGYIEKRRWKAEWILRRAEVFGLMGDDVLMRADAERALDEIVERLRVSKPDEFLYELRARAAGFLEGAGVRSRSADEEDEEDEIAAASAAALDAEVE